MPVIIDSLAVARWQFAVTTIYHFFFVPLTLGLSILVAIMETAYVRTGNETYKRMTKFWGKLFLINFAMGVVTGIVLEFQFGMNWSEYSRFVGDIFGWGLIPLTRALTAESFTDLDAMYRSLIARGAETVVPGHGPVCTTATLARREGSGGRARVHLGRSGADHRPGPGRLGIAARGISPGTVGRSSRGLEECTRSICAAATERRAGSAR